MNNPFDGTRIKFLEIGQMWCYYFNVEKLITESRHLIGSGGPKAEAGMPRQGRIVARRRDTLSFLARQLTS